MAHYGPVTLTETPVDLTDADVAGLTPGEKYIAQIIGPKRAGKWDGDDDMPMARMLDNNGAPDHEAQQAGGLLFFGRMYEVTIPAADETTWVWASYTNCALAIWDAP